MFLTRASCIRLSLVWVASDAWLSRGWPWRLAAARRAESLRAVTAGPAYQYMQ